MDFLDKPLPQRPEPPPRTDVGVVPIQSGLHLLGKYAPPPHNSVPKTCRWTELKDTAGVWHIVLVLEYADPLAPELDMTFPETKVSLKLASRGRVLEIRFEVLEETWLKTFARIEYTYWRMLNEVKRAEKVHVYYEEWKILQSILEYNLPGMIPEFK